MNFVKLKEICQLLNGRAYKQEELLSSGKYKVLRVGNFFSDKDYFYSNLDLEENKYCDTGDLLFAWSASFGPKIWNGGKVIYHYHIWKIILSESVDKKYLYYYLFFMSERIKAEGHGGIMIHTTKQEMEERLIPLPPIDEQKRIAAVLDKCADIIAKRKQQLSALDNLIKARFVEMFGDPETNPMGWPKVGLPMVVQGKASNGYFAKREEYVKDGNVAVLGVAYVVNRMYSQVDNLPHTNATAEDIKKYRVKYGDMLFCRSSLVAEGIGKASIIPENTPDNTLFECHVIRLPLNLEKCIPEFMQVLSTTDYFRNQMIAQSKTATMTTIGQDGILKAIIILPQIEKQRDFYFFVKQIDKTKANIQKSLEKSQLLFDSLMQEYFG